MINYVFTPKQEEIMLSALSKFGSENRVKKAIPETAQIPLLIFGQAEASIKTH